MNVSRQQESISQRGASHEVLKGFQCQSELDYFVPVSKICLLEHVT